jgi:TolB protein
MAKHTFLRRLPIIPALAAGLLFAIGAGAQNAPQTADQSILGEIPVTGSTQEHVIKLAILPSLAPDMEDVIVRGVVRRDLELSGMFEVIPDRKAPAGLYGFDDPVDIEAWRKIAAEVIVKVAARKHQSGKIQVFGLAYFLNVGKDPVYQKTLLVPADQVRVTAHRITDALLGAITGRDGGFASRMTYSGAWGRARRVLTLDADGHELRPRTPEDDTSIAPAFGPNGFIYFTVSKNYAPFELNRLVNDKPEKVKVPFTTSVYGVAFNADHTKMAVAVAEKGGSSIYVGNPDGSDMKKVSTTELATHPVFSPSGKLAWIGGGNRQGTQRVYVDGKPASPAGFTAAAPTFCDTEDGIRLVFAVAVGGDHYDLVMTGEKGGPVSRLTQNQGSNTYPACSPDGRLLAFFSTRGNKRGLYMMSLKRFGTQLVSTQYGESLRWARLPPAAEGAKP